MVADRLRGAVPLLYGAPMAATPPTPGESARPSAQRLAAILLPVIVVIVVAIVLLIHFTGGSSGSGSPQATPGGNLSTPGSAQPGPNQGGGAVSP